MPGAVATRWTLVERSCARRWLGIQGTCFSKELHMNSVELRGCDGLGSP